MWKNVECAKWNEVDIDREIFKNIFIWGIKNGQTDRSREHQYGCQGQGGQKGGVAKNAACINATLKSLTNAKWVSSRTLHHC